MLELVLLIVQLSVLAAAAYAGRTKLKRLLAEAQTNGNTELDEPLEGDMSEVDKSILRLLADRQGVMYQSEIVKELGLPKSTVHKALRRLSEGGFVEIQKRGRLNVVILKKATSEASTT